MNERGFVPLLVPFAIAIFLIVGGTLYYNFREKTPEMQPLPSVEVSTSPEASSSASPAASLKASWKPSAKPSALATPKATVSPAASATPQSSPSASSQPSSAQPTPTPEPKVVCGVHFDPGSGTAPVDVKLIYSASFNVSTGDYVTNVQWDWDGDGNWDTDFSANNQHTTHTFDKAGTYNVKMKLQTQQGITTEVCSNTITIQ